MLSLVAQGLSNQEIATKLVISERTVRTHVSNILGKLHLANRTQAARYALARGPGQAGRGLSRPAVAARARVHESHNCRILRLSDTSGAASTRPLCLVERAGSGLRG